MNLSLFASTFAFSFKVGTKQDSTNSPFIGVKPDYGIEPVAPCIILEPEEEEEEVMTSNLRSSFKERQYKHLSESIEVASSLAKRTCVESSQEVPILDTPLSLMPLVDVARTSRALIVRSPIKNYACPIQERISTTPTPDDGS